MVLGSSPADDGARYPHTATYADRRNGRLGDSRRSGLARAVAEHRSGSAHVRQPKPMPSMKADHCQAVYFLGLLVQSRQEVDQRIKKCRGMIATEARRDLAQIGRLRRQMNVDEQERLVLDGLIEDLRRRFPRHPSEVPSMPRRARSVVR
jgi:hypothetical protein